MTAGQANYPTVISLINRMCFLGNQKNIVLIAIYLQTQSKKMERFLIASLSDKGSSLQAKYLSYTKALAE